MTAPVFGVDRDPLAQATWGSGPLHCEDWDACEEHGTDLAACRAYEEREQRLADEMSALTACGGIRVLTPIPCRWTQDDPDACQFCSGEACGQCYRPSLAHPCEHAVDERHLSRVG